MMSSYGNGDRINVIVESRREILEKRISTGWVKHWGLSSVGAEHWLPRSLHLRQALSGEQANYQPQHNEREGKAQLGTTWRPHARAAMLPVTGATTAPTARREHISVIFGIGIDTNFDTAAFRPIGVTVSPPKIQNLQILFCSLEGYTDISPCFEYHIYQAANDNRYK